MCTDMPPLIFTPIINPINIGIVINKATNFGPFSNLDLTQ